ncbi:g7012 [Coccomyxa elongata]
MVLRNVPTLLAVLLLCCLSNISAQSIVNENFKMPKNIKSYSEYLKYAGMATGALPIEPLAEEAFAPAEGPSSAAPMGAPAGEAQPSYMANHVPNPNPSIQDFVEAYKPVNAALDKAFEQRITSDNAKKVQFELAVAAAPLQMLINDANQAQIKNFQQIASQVMGTNPLTGTTATAPASAAAQSATASDGTTVTSTAATAASADTTGTPSTTSSDPLGWLRIPFLGKK